MKGVSFLLGINISGVRDFGGSFYTVIHSPPGKPRPTELGSVNLQSLGTPFPLGQVPKHRKWIDSVARFIAITRMSIFQPVGLCSERCKVLIGALDNPPLWTVMPMGKPGPMSMSPCKGPSFHFQLLVVVCIIYGAFINSYSRESFGFGMGKAIWP